MKKMIFFSVEEVCVELGYSVNQQILEKNMKKKIVYKGILGICPLSGRIGGRLIFFLHFSNHLLPPEKVVKYLILTH